jgi:predicted RNA-binding protein with PUA-like domain
MVSPQREVATENVWRVRERGKKARRVKPSPGTGCIESGQQSVRDAALFPSGTGWIRVERMADHYLLKTEPSEHSFEDLLRDKKTLWDGVSNPVAVRNLAGMTPGARLIIYETGDRKSAVGTAKVASVDASNPKNPQVTIEAGKAIAKPVTLAEIKANKLFGDSPLVRQGRLSVVPLTAAQYEVLTK